VENHWGDDVAAFLLESPLISQLRCLDFTNVTDRGAAVLYEHASKLESVEQSWVASTKEGRRTWNHYAAVSREEPRPPPAFGELEISDAWRTRLRQHFGRRVRFDLRRAIER
jgi:hypothetical protein